MAVSAVSGPAFVILDYKCSGNAYEEPVNTCYRVISTAHTCSSCELEQ